MTDEEVLLGERLRTLLADVAERLLRPVSRGQMYVFYMCAIIAVCIGLGTAIHVIKHTEAAIHQRVLKNCEEQNARNRNTIAEAEKIPGNRQIVISLINDLAPYRNCQIVSKEAGF